MEEEQEIEVKVTGGADEKKEDEKEEADPTESPAKKTKTKKVTKMVDVDT